MNVMGKLVLSVVGALATGTLAWTLSGQRINLIPSEAVNLYDKPVDGQVVKVLGEREVIPVLECEDLKHYIVPVVLIDGRRAYVLEGEYHLDRRHVWDLNAGPISFSCP